MVAETADSFLHLGPNVGGREHSGNAESLMKPQSLSAVTHLLQDGCASLSSPNSYINWGPSVKAYDLMGAILIQTTTGSFLRTKTALY